jgi:hypothetical protein
MSTSPLLVGQSVRAPAPARAEPRVAWGLLGSAGLAFTVIAMADLVLVAFPLRFGDGKWEFDTVTAVLGGMPLLAVGLVLGYTAALTRHRTASLRAWSGFMLIVAAVLAVAFALYLMRVPSAFSGGDAGPVQVEIAKGVIKTACQGVAYPAALCWLGLKGLTHPASP